MCESMYVQVIRAGPKPEQRRAKVARWVE